MKRILVSACLLGEPVRYDGKAKALQDRLLSQWSTEGRLVPLCPEVMGGLPVPRQASEIEGASGESVLAGEARLRTKDGQDMTAFFLRGAHRALEIARQEEIEIAILKARSPSCGSRQIYDGTFNGRLKAGMGVTAALLRAEGVQVFSEEQLQEVEDLLFEIEREQ